MGWQIGCIEELPAVAGCYALYVSGKLFYIGSTVDLSRRFNLHHEVLDMIPPHLLSLKFKVSHRYGDWLMIELRMIRRLKPPANITGVKSASRVQVRRMLAELTGVEQEVNFKRLPRVAQCKWCQKVFRRRRIIHSFCSKDCRFKWHNERVAKVKLVLDDGEKLTITSAPPGKKYAWEISRS